jgi:beta-xylosidase
MALTACLAMVAAWLAAACGSRVVEPAGPDERPARLENPFIRDRYTSDPAALVHNGRVYLYAGHDEATLESGFFVMRDWRLYSSADMVNWEDHGSPISVETFAWARSDAWASQAIERDGRFYFYSTVRHATIPGFSIGVAVADRPEGPYRDARGSALITNDMTRGAIVNGREMDWDDIDPTVFIDDDGQAYLFWGNTILRYAKLKANMIELDGPIVDVDVPSFTEAPWIHKYEGRYYLSYAYGYPEKIAYATAARITGPYTFQGVINETIPNSPTNHQSIIEFEGNWYFFYHNAALTGGGEYRRSVAVERMYYFPDGRIRPITQARYGLEVQPPQETASAGVTSP